MENALLIGLSRQMALARTLDVVANNVANVNTTGFKADDALFREFLMPVASDNTFKGADRRLSYVHDRATMTDFAQGSVERTGNPLDVAISGDAFLSVQTAGGIRYTRDGSFEMNAAGQLATPDGNLVMGTNGPITFLNGDREINIAPDGTVTVKQGTNPADQVRGKLQLSSFANPQQLQKQGSNLYLAPPGVAPQAAPKAKVVQGAVEKSNVSAVGAMTRLIEVTRTYTDVAGLIAQQSDMHKSAIQRLAEVPA